MSVTDLLAGRGLLLARRLVAAADQPGVGEEVADLREAGDVVDLIEQHQGLDLADAGNGEQAMIRVAVVDLGVAMQIQLELANLRVVGVDESQVGLDAALHGGMWKVS